MIRELINFTNDLIEDIPDIMEWKVQPSKGLHVFIDIDENGQWVNQNLQKGKDYDYYDGKGNDLSPLLKETIPYYVNSLLVNNDMNKCLDNDKCVVDGLVFPIKQIQTCSPYVIGFKRKEDQEIELVGNKNKTIKKDRFEIIAKRSKVYLSKASLVCSLNKSYNLIIKQFAENIDEIITVISSQNISTGKKNINVSELSKNDFIMIYLQNISKIELERAYDTYLTDKLFAKKDYNSSKNITDTTYGLPSYKIVDNEGKIFLKHLTGFQYMGINNRLSAIDIKLLHRFMFLSDNGVFPNPLPIFVDKNETTGIKTKSTTI